MLPHVRVPSAHVKYSLLIPLLFMSGTLIVARWRGPDLSSAKTAPSDASISIQQQERQLEAEIVTVTPTGFEPGEINRPQGRFILAVDNRSGLEEVQLYFERETGARINSSPTRKGKLAWRDVIDFPPGTYILRAVNDESWRCLLARTSEGSSELAKELIERGADVIEFPKWKKTLLPIDLTKVASYENILFTSPESVDEFFTAVMEDGVDIRTIRANFYGASLKSIKALQKRGFVASPVDEMHESNALLIVGDDRFLKRKYETADIMVTSKKELDLQFLPLFKRMLDEANLNTMVFPSSVSVELFVKAVNECELNAYELLEGLQVVSMGRQTEAAVRSAGLPSLGMPENPTKEALVEYLAARPIEEV